MTVPRSTTQLLLWRLGGVAVGTVGVGLAGLALWHYTRGPQYGDGVTVLLVGVGLAWVGLQMVRRSQHPQ